MVSISNVDQIMLLVRSQLGRIARDKRAASAQRTAKSGQTKSLDTPSSSLGAIRTLGDIEDREFDRLVVRALLIDQFGESLSGDPSFEQIADRTLTMMMGDDALKAQLADLRRLLREF